MIANPAPPSDARSAVFTLVINVGDDDIDLLGHASNIAYLRWVQDVAVAHSVMVGFDIQSYSELGAVFVVRRHEIDYLRPVLRGERLELRTWIDSAAAAKCIRMTDIVRLADATAAKETVVARARTTWGFVELTTGRPTRIPDSVRVAFAQPTIGERAAERSTSSASETGGEPRSGERIDSSPPPSA
jgi:acyl-CoA thioester hydrolase